uniref:(northern house mosquito) hypothetical protein n=1 Tax=Culex pipiens TaxID=7175 RepID=A0A8D8CP43_CULPI
MFGSCSDVETNQTNLRKSWRAHRQPLPVQRKPMSLCPTMTRISRNLPGRNRISTRRVANRKEELKRKPWTVEMMKKREMKRTMKTNQRTRNPTSSLRERKRMSFRRTNPKNPKVA